MWLKEINADHRTRKIQFLPSILPLAFRLPWWLSGKESTCKAGDEVLVPGLGRSPHWKWHPLQYSCWDNHMNRGVWWATVHAVPKRQTQLRNWVHTQFLGFGAGHLTFLGLICNQWNGGLLILSSRSKILYVLSWCKNHPSHFFYTLTTTYNVLDFFLPLFSIICFILHNISSLIFLEFTSNHAFHDSLLITK